MECNERWSEFFGCETDILKETEGGLSMWWPIDTLGLWWMWWRK